MMIRREEGKMAKIDITGENVINALLQSSGMTWPELVSHFCPSLRGGDEMGLINCLYGLCDVQFITIDGVAHGRLNSDAVIKFVHNKKMVARASDIYRRSQQSLRNCWNSNGGDRLSRERYYYQCEPIFKMPRMDVPQWGIFVAMPFRRELDPVYRDHICAVAQRQNVSIGRADELFSEQSIVDEIWALIIRSRVVIADCTGKNANVFYEIGIAHTIGKPVIAITQSPEDVPFDLIHRRYIKYEMTPRGMSEFEKTLATTLAHVLEADAGN